MPNKNIPLKDKAIVKRRLAQGMSYRQAMKGTEIKSKNTVMLIARKEKDDIGRLREKYLVMIRGFGGDAETRAKVVAKMLKATKLFGKDAVEHPDSRARLAAVKYIDKLAGLAPKEVGTTVNILSNPEFIQQYQKKDW